MPETIVVPWDLERKRCQVCPGRNLDTDSDLLTYVIRDSLATLILVAAAIGIEFVKKPGLLPVQLSSLTLLILTAVEITSLVEMIRRSIKTGNELIDELSSSGNYIKKLLGIRRHRRGRRSN